MAPLAGHLSTLHPIAVLCGVGAACMALGMLWLILLPPGAAFVWSMAGMLLGGIGFGFFQTPNNRALLAGAPRHRSGAAGGLQATTRVFGQGFGTALVGVAFTLSSAPGAMEGEIGRAACGDRACQSV